MKATSLTVNSSRKIEKETMGGGSEQSKADPAAHGGEEVGTFQKVRQHVKEFVEASPEQHTK